MLAQRLRRLANINQAMAQSLLFAGMVGGVPTRSPPNKSKIEELIFKIFPVFFLTGWYSKWRAYQKLVNLHFKVEIADRIIKQKTVVDERWPRVEWHWANAGYVFFYISIM